MKKEKMLLTLAAFLAGVGATFLMGPIIEGKKVTTETAAGNCFVSQTPRSLFKLRGKEYTIDDLPQDIQQSFLLTQMDAYRRTSEIVDELAVRTSLSSQNGIPEGKEVFSSVMATDAEIESYFKSNFGNGKSSADFSRIKDAIQDSLNQQKISAFVSAKMQNLRGEAEFRNSIEIPCGPKRKFDHRATAFTIEESKGPIEIVFFSDFSSPRVRQIISPLTQYAKENRDKVTLRELYLFKADDSAGDALASLSYCFYHKEQKLFAGFRNAAYAANYFRGEKSGSQVGGLPTHILDLAKTVGMKEEDLQVCLKSKELQSFIKASKNAAREAGVTAAPAFFIRNRMLALPASNDPVATLAELVKNIRL